MATRYRINLETCISCAACVPECPVGAISEGEPFTINPEICNACAACPPVCPVEAIEAYEWTPPEPPGPQEPATGLTISMGLGLKGD